METDCVSSTVPESVFSPLHPGYLNYETRLKSFTSWPKFMYPSPKSLARCGLFYHGRSDKTICFCCGVTLSDWEPTDNEWYEHRHWSRQCMFLKMVGLPENIVDGKDVYGIGSQTTHQSFQVTPAKWYLPNYGN